MIVQTNSCSLSCLASGTCPLKSKLCMEYLHIPVGSEVWMGESRRAPRSACQLTLSAACRWSDTAPASAALWGFRRWSRTGTPPARASRHLRGKGMKNANVTPLKSFREALSLYESAPVVRHSGAGRLRLSICGIPVIHWKRHRCKLRYFTWKHKVPQSGFKPRNWPITSEP